MDAERFDFLTRRLGSGKTRRHALAALAAVPALWMQRGRAAQLGPPPCGSAGDVCTMLAGCCDGLTCVTSAINTNYGVCVSGGGGGTVASGTSLVSPFSESAQATGTVDAPASTTSTTTTTGTTTTTDPKAEREAKLQEKRSRRSTRRNKIQSRRTTKASERKTRREDAAEAAELAAGPYLDFDSAYPEATSGSDIGKPYEVLRVSNPTDFSVFISRVALFQDARTASLPSKTISAGGSLKLVSGRPNDATVASDEFLWLFDTIACPDQSVNNGWVIKAAFSGEAENRTYTIHCNGMIEGLPVATVDATNNRKKRKRKQQAAARRKKRKNNKKDN